MAFLLPEHVFEHYYEVTPAELQKRNLRGLLLDMDNTLVPYEETTPRPEFAEWLLALQKSGIAVALVTNNHKKRLATFNAPHGLPAYANSLKPLPHNLRRAAKRMNIPVKECAMLGDQLLTDMLAAHFAGMTAFIVPPIRDKKNPIVRLKRALERPLMKRYYKRENRHE